MNFKKSKDIKRASYYVWFLGSKESKGFRGDEYVTPVLNYLLENECNFEPSKVTLQVSNKGLKIIQILTVPRKSSKLSADQQTQLFANSRRSKPENSCSSLLKTEQVKHHISHNSITWIYQEEDIICAILLLYNPITRCPVHVHAYRCDSIETADNLRQHLQTLVDKPENQKRFRDIESRLVAKGLLIPCSYKDYTDEVLPSHNERLPYNEVQRYTSANKTLNSDGRSTRTEASENSEESNSSDLGYAIRSKNVHESKEFNRPVQLPSTLFESQQKPQKTNRFMMNEDYNPKFKSNKNKSKQQDDEQEVPSGMTAALYDSLAAELRAKLGNPKMGPLLLPPKDYDSNSGSSGGRKEKRITSKHQMCPLTRSESSGKSSSGIGSDEALSSENQVKKLPYYRNYRDAQLLEPQSYLDIERHHQRLNGYIYTDHEKAMYSMPMYSSEEEDFGQSEVDAEDTEEDVLFTSHHHKSKSTFDLLNSKYKPPYEQPRPSHPRPVKNRFRRQTQQPISEIESYLERKSNTNALMKMYSSNPNLCREEKSFKDKTFVVGRREQRDKPQVLHPGSYDNDHRNVSASGGGGGGRLSHHQPNNKPLQKFYFADAEFREQKPQQKIYHDEKERQNHKRVLYNKHDRQLDHLNSNLTSLEYSSPSGPTSLGFHVNHQTKERQLPSSSSSKNHVRSYQPERYELANSKGKHFVPSRSSGNLARESSRFEALESHLAMRKKLDQPYTRCSYIEVDHNNHESRYNYLHPLRPR